jgi:hypothetical protein
MKRTLIAFALAPLIPATIFGVAGIVNALIHHDEIGASSVPAMIFGAFFVAFFFGVLVSAAISWTFGVLVFLCLRKIRKESMVTYSLAGVALGATYGLLTIQERVGWTLAFYLSAFCVFGVSASAGFWAIRRRGPIQPPQTTTGSSAPSRV